MQETLLKEFYWELVKWDGERIPVKPANVEFVQNKLKTGEGFITTKNRSIAVKDIKDFVATDRPYTDQKLLAEGAAQAFNEPIYIERETEYGYTETCVEGKWVKKVVTARRYNSYYRFGSYRLLEEDDSTAVIAFRLPTHIIDHHTVMEITEQEIQEYHL